MTKCILGQVGDAACKPALDLVYGFHLDYCKRHDIEYVVSDASDLDIRDRQPFWYKILFIVNTLKTLPDGSIFVYLDADCLVRLRDVDIRTVFKFQDSELAMANLLTTTEDFFNAGAMFMRKSNQLIKFFEDVWVMGPLNTTLGINNQDEATINYLLKNSLIDFEAVSAKWNCFKETPHPNPIIKAWHGLHDVHLLPQMKAEMARVIEMEKQHGKS